MKKIMEDMLKEKVWAVVGASNNKEKFGFKVFERLMEKGYRAYPVNPSCEEIEGKKCYKTLSEIPEVPGSVSMVIPPRAAIGVLEEAAALGIKKIWFQPGAESEEVIEKANLLHLDVVYDNCVLVELG